MPGTAIPYAGSNALACCFGLQSGNGKNIAAGKTNQVTATIAWETGIGTLTSRTGYDKRKIQNDFDFDGSYIFSTFSEGRPKFEAFQQNLDFVINAIDNLDLLIGANYFNEKSTLVNTSIGYTGNLESGRNIGFRNTRHLKTDAYAVYGDATYHVTDKLAIGVGGRYSSDKKYQDLTSQGFNLLTTNFVVPETHKTFSKFTPRATIRYEVADRTNVYATYSQGFRSGSFNAAASSVAAAILPIKPEEIKSYEIGFKTAQRFFRAEIAAFYYDYKNLNTSLTVPNPLNPLSPTLIVGNAPKATIKGIDGQIVASPIEKLNITVGAAYVHARYGNFANAVGQGTNATNTLNLGFGGQVQ
ncbi:MAG: TonB-dependent receptor, partial [Rhodococcus sp. (in: high G+C Gram-positive bacteria)]